MDDLLELIKTIGAGKNKTEKIKPPSLTPGKGKGKGKGKNKGGTKGGSYDEEDQNTSEEEDTEKLRKLSSTAWMEGDIIDWRELRKNINDSEVVKAKISVVPPDRS